MLSLPQPPIKPSASDCCKNGCIPCVWDIYFEEVERYEKMVEKLKKEKPNEKENATNPGPSSFLPTSPDSSIDSNILTSNSNKQFKPHPISLTPIYSTLLSPKTSNSPKFFISFNFSSKEQVASEKTPSSPYKPGDHIGITPPNPLEQVNKLLSIMKLTGEEKIYLNNDEDEMKIDSKSTITTESQSSLFLNFKPPSYISYSSIPFTSSYLLTQILNISAPPTQLFIQMIAELCPVLEEKYKLQYFSSLRGIKDYEIHIKKPRLSIVDFLEKIAPNCFSVLTLQFLVDFLPCLIPRKYTISSSALTNSQSLSIVYSLHPKGLCTNWLTEVVSIDFNVTINATINRGEIFSHNEDEETDFFLNTPTIQICSGSGVAPMRSFLEHRKNLIQKFNIPSYKISPCFLFFGCHNFSESFIFKDEFEEMEKCGWITKLVLNDRKVRVQELLLSFWEEIGDLMSNKNAKIFVCGYPKLNEVDKVLAEIIHKYSLNHNVIESDGMKCVEDWIIKGRYKKEIFE